MKLMRERENKDDRRARDRLMPLKKIGTERGRGWRQGESITVNHSV